MSTEITKELLEQDGWIEMEGDSRLFYWMEKKLPNNNPINNDPDDTGISLVLHNDFNEPQIGILFPDGGKLNLIIEDFEHLKRIENSIAFYDCPY